MTERPIHRLFRLAGFEPSTADDIETEIAFHLDQTIAMLVQQGWKPDAAREEARRRFGSIERARTVLRQIDRGTRRDRKIREWLHSIWQDVRYAMRGLRRDPVFSAAVIGTLGLALAANATMYGVVDRLLLRAPALLREPATIRQVYAARYFDQGHEGPSSYLSYPAFAGVRDQTSSFDQVAATAPLSVSVGVGTDARPASAEAASGSYFALLGVTPVKGRFFTPDDDRPPSGTPVVVLSEGLWKGTFGADPAILNRRILIQGSPYQVIGIAPARFTGTGFGQVDLWIPIHSGMSLSAGSSLDVMMVARGWQFLHLFVRLKPGISFERAGDDVQRAYAAVHADFRDYERLAETSLESLVPTENPTLRAGPPQVAGWLLGVAIVVLIIASTNVGNMVFARGLSRTGELAVRQALGVSRTRLLRQLLTESLVLACFGLIVGLLLSRWGGGLVRGLLPEVAWDRSLISLPVLVVTGIAAVLTTVAASLFPLLRIAGRNPASALHGMGRRTGSRHSRLLRTGLLTLQTTLATILLVVAGLFVHSLRAVNTLDLGFTPSQMSIAQLDVPSDSSAIDRSTQMAYQVVARLEQRPDIDAAGLMQGAPFMSNYAEGVRVPGLDSLPRFKGGGPYFFRATPGALRALDPRLLRGRLFTPEDDRPEGHPVAVVTERMAQALWPGESALGKCFHAPRTGPCHEVVGIIANLHRQGLEEDPFLLYFTPLSRVAAGNGPEHLVVRSRLEPEQVAEVVRSEFLSLRPDLPYLRVAPYEAIIAPHARSWRLGAMMFTLFGLLSVVITAFGIYGVLSFNVAQQTKELGIRTALGATRGHLMGRIFWSGVPAAVAGIVIGLLAAVGGARFVGPLLFQTSPSDPLVLVGVAVLIGGLSVLATAGPARRATLADPIDALRAE